MTTSELRVKIFCDGVTGVGELIEENLLKSPSAEEATGDLRTSRGALRRFYRNAVILSRADGEGSWTAAATLHAFVYGVQKRRRSRRSPKNLSRDRPVSHVRAAHERSAFDVMKAECARGVA